MKQKKVFLMSGPPACGKSTWIRNHMTPNSEWISRDKVRFSIIQEGEDYFSHEDEVFDTFIAYINQTLERDDVDTIYIDATHINKKSRQKTLRKIRKNNIEELNCVYFSTPLAVCQSRNHLRSGLEKVPAYAIANMHKYKTYPEADEKFNKIYIIDENSEVKEVIINE